jgi:hypothetical protein
LEKLILSCCSGYSFLGIKARIFLKSSGISSHIAALKKAELYALRILLLFCAAIGI